MPSMRRPGKTASSLSTSRPMLIWLSRLRRCRDRPRSDQSKAHLAPGTGSDNPGLPNAHDNTGDDENCQIPAPEHPHQQGADLGRE